MFTRQILVGLQRVRDKNHLLVTMIGIIYLLIANDGNSTAFIKSLAGKLIAVKRIALQGNKNAALGTVAAVGGDGRMLLIDCVKFFAIHNLYINFRAKIQ